MKKQEIKKLSKSEILKNIDKFKKDLFNFRFQKINSQITNPSKINDTTFSRTVAKLISKWTGRIWQIHSSTSNLGKSLHDEDIINQQKEIEIMKNHPEVKKILNEFPESKIHALTDLGEINDEEVDINQPKMKKEK